MEGSSDGLAAEDGCSSGSAAATAEGYLDAWLQQVEQQPQQLVVCSGAAAAEQSRQQQLALAFTLQQLDALAAAVAAASSFNTKSSRKHRKGEEVQREVPMISFSSLLLGAAPLSFDMLPGSSADEVSAAAAVKSARHSAAAATLQMLPVSLQQVWVLVETAARQLLRRLKGKVLQLHAAELRCRKRLKQEQKRQKQQQRRSSAAAKRRVSDMHCAAGQEGEGAAAGVCENHVEGHVSEDDHIEAAPDEAAATAAVSANDIYAHETAAADVSVFHLEGAAAQSIGDAGGDETAKRFKWRNRESGFFWLLKQQPSEGDQLTETVSTAAAAATVAIATVATVATAGELVGGQGKSPRSDDEDGEAEVTTACLEEEEQSLEEGEEEEKRDKNEDIFFSMEDMQRFVLQEEEKEMAELGKKRRPRGGGEGGERRYEQGTEVSSSADEEEEMREMLYGDVSAASSAEGIGRGKGAGDETKVMFADFFDLPAGMKKKKELGHGDTVFVKGKKRRTAAAAEEERAGSYEDEVVDSQEAGKKRKRQRRGNSSSEEEKEMFPEGDLDAEETRLQQALDALERQQHHGRKSSEDAGAAGAWGDEEESAASLSSPEGETGSTASDEADAAEGSRAAAGGDTEEKKKKKSSSLIGMLARSAAVEAEILELEQQLVSKKEWKLQGEVWGRQRPRNALLDVERLDLPLLASTCAAANSEHLGREAEEEEETQQQEEEGSNSSSKGSSSSSLSQVSDFIERVVKQRIEETLFDDVVRRKALPPNVAQGRPRQDAAREATGDLDMQQSSVGLGDLYAMEYQRQLAQSQSSSSSSKRGIVRGGGQQVSEGEKKKAELLELFGKLMYKLDCLSNTSFRPAPAAALHHHHGAAGEAVEEGVAAVQVEEAVPLLLSNAHRKAPQELYKPQKKTDDRELTQEERRAQRRSQKERRRRRVTQMIQSGALTAAGARERQMKLEAKNKMQRADRIARKQTGLTQHEAVSELRKNKKRVKFQDLLSDALKATQNQERRSSNITSGRRF